MLPNPPVPCLEQGTQETPNLRVIFELKKRRGNRMKILHFDIEKVSNVARALRVFFLFFFS